MFVNTYTQNYYSLAKVYGASQLNISNSVADFQWYTLIDAAILLESCGSRCYC